ncbi:hypothetical protein PPACK8108_LOCUS1430 [Phakopsora pachyrhizi]|uniref:Uncharacterized protein n=1 Tax=Phakopsora pachyrhizi TaxID=170000 RepID=A0AAV0AHP3_PHAPC|nr:hypothetical protein PPACK8108_LOCUS1430 [Phakopsora pachyrhizi]
MYVKEKRTKLEDLEQAFYAYSAIHSRPPKKNKASSHSSTSPTNPTAASSSSNYSTNDHLTQSHHPSGSSKIAQFLVHQLRQKSLPCLETPADLFPLEPPTGPQPSLIAMNLFEPVDGTKIDGNTDKCDDDNDADDVDEDNEYGSDLEEVGESGRVCFAPSQATIYSLCCSSSPQPMSPRALPIGLGPLLILCVGQVQFVRKLHVTGSVVQVNNWINLAQTPPASHVQFVGKLLHLGGRPSAPVPHPNN